jgi:hypothetical protein
LGAAAAGGVLLGSPGIAAAALADCAWADVVAGVLGAAGAATSPAGGRGLGFTSGAGGRNWIQK